MTNTIFIRIHNDHSVDWAIPGQTAEIQNHSGNSLAQLTDICHGKKIIVFIPGDMVHIGSHIIPVKNRQKILQAIPFAMEDDLIGDVEDFHFAIPARTPTNDIPVCAISHTQMSSIIDLLKEHQLQPQLITADTFALPWQQAHWTMLLEDDTATVRTDQFSGFTVDSENLNEYIDIAIQQAGDDAPTSLNIFDRRLDQEPSIESLLPDSLSLQDNPAQTNTLDILIDSFHENDTINLLQGDYAVKYMRNQSLKKWTPAAAVFILLLLVNLVDGIFEYKQLSNEATKLDQKIKQIFRQALPDVKRIVNPKAQMQQQLAALKSSNKNGQADFFSHFSNAIKALKKDNSIIVKNINYRNNRLDIELSISDLQALDKLKLSIAQTGAKVEIRSASVQGKKVSARLRISGGTS